MILHHEQNYCDINFLDSNSIHDSNRKPDFAISATQQY